MNALRQRWARIAITLVPIALVLAHVVGFWRLPFLEGLDNFIYDARLRATMPRTLDPRIVIVDIDDASLQQLGQWPWSRDHLARLTTEVMDRQQAVVLGFDILFVEPDESSGLDVLRRLADGPLQHQTGLAEEIERLAPHLDHDAAFADALAGQRVALGFYLTQTLEPRAKGVLPAPLLLPGAFPEGRSYATRWNGFVGSIPQLEEAAPAAGFLNVLLDAERDGIVRSVPLIARYTGTNAQPGYYESLGLVVYRLAVGADAVTPVFAPAGGSTGPPALTALLLKAGPKSLRIPVDSSASALVPFRGPGGARGGSFRHISAVDVVRGGLPPGELKDKVVLVGSTAPGLEDLRSAPVGAAYPGVEVHANIVSGLLDGRMPVVPDYAAGYELVTVLAAGLVLAFGLSLSAAPRAVLIAVITTAALVGLNTWLFIHSGLVLPLASALAAVGLAFVLNMSWGYLVETRASRNLAHLFGTYVPPELVNEMRADPERYSMRAESKELTVMFCDMRGFTKLAEQMAPVELQDFLNEVFSRLTEVISAQRGTVDKYMGDCVMAFWGAPVDMPNHAELAVRAAVEMAAAVQELNAAHRQSGRPEISIGIGINSGMMSVGDMGSAVRRSYTVVGDAVNLASRIEGLGGHYGVEIVASQATQRLVSGFVWQELDCVRVQGKVGVARIFTPVCHRADASRSLYESLERWNSVLSAYRAQDWEEAQALLAPLISVDAKKVLYQLYAQRLASMTLQPKNPNWDGATRFETK
ncbi:adenylate/guanylate cyclase domain-containing protein [Variovorax sp. J2P1-59]|uniref:CHASE2 domain-containing protein n=1 Tax=Variovorax flavidus TaxID=3053501 RepID=UPI002577176D|nr:adenylate/guanylate cyclase domain-containing protein [Variovorax sp. J2P1-59]MDM0075162.1 adenylate/guanylate cyclase domain-containing protein [Variovorax sp. J2P1-59]